MPKNHLITKRVFVDIDKNKFLNLDEKLGLPVSKDLAEMKQRFEILMTKNQEDLKALAQHEEIIIQMRAKNVVDSELRLSLSRNYIYARSLFFRKGKEINDIRVVMGKTSEFKGSLNKLIKDPEFRILCKTKLLETMDNEITSNILQLTETYEETTRST